MFNLFSNKNDEIDNVNDNVNVIVNDDTRFNIKEAYNELRTNVAFSISKKECKVICVTSALASEGKSTTSVNNAITFAKSGKRILLIDCDLRKPTVDKVLNIKSDKGLSDILVSESDIDEAICKQVYENLDVITSGKIPPNPVELISSEIMADTIEKLREKYDYIFIDAPPVNVVTDAALISKYTDGVIVVVRQYVAEKNMVRDAVNKLKFVNAKIIGFVLNDVTSSKTGYGYYKYGKKSRYGYYSNGY
ncbi:MAG: CpsD/CapB family tyrosine-protein kinase [Lachnospirales bacterium]